MGQYWIIIILFSHLLHHTSLYILPEDDQELKLFLIFHPPFMIQTNILSITLCLFSLILGIILYFFISVAISFIGFWSNETWGPRFIFYQTVGFLAGSLLPLDILPKSLYTILQYLPFSYLIYFPTKLYLGEVSASDTMRGFAILVIWIGLMYLLVKQVWARGLKEYTAQGIWKNIFIFGSK